MRRIWDRYIRDLMAEELPSVPAGPLDKTWYPSTSESHFLTILVLRVLISFGLMTQRWKDRAPIKKTSAPHDGMVTHDQIPVYYHQLDYWRMAGLVDTRQHRQATITRAFFPGIPFLFCIHSCSISAVTGWSGSSLTTRAFWIWGSIVWAVKVALTRFSICQGQFLWDPSAAAWMPSHPPHLKKKKREKKQWSCFSSRINPFKETGSNIRSQVW